MINNGDEPILSSDYNVAKNGKYARILFYNKDHYDYIKSKHISPAEAINYPQSYVNTIDGENLKDMIALDRIIHTYMSADKTFRELDRRERELSNELINIANDKQEKGYYMITNVIGKLHYEFISDDSEDKYIVVVGNMSQYAQVLACFKNSKQDIITFMKKVARIPDDYNNSVSLELLKTIVNR